MKIVFLDPIGLSKDLILKRAKNILGETHEIVCFEEKTFDPLILSERAKDADIIVIDNLRFGENILANCKNLKFISVAFTGVDHVDLDYCKKNGIIVSNAAGYSTVAVADYTFATAINVLRKIVEADASCRSGKSHKLAVGYELEGLTFGVVGLGAIGMRVAKIANAFGCTVLAYNRSKKEIEGVSQVSLKELLQKSDIVSIHLPLNVDTKAFISAKEIAMMKKSAILINSARGPIVDSKALAEALKNGKIAGAGIDVFDVEPPIPTSEPLLLAPNTVLTPHIAFASKQSFEKRANIVINNIKGFLDGNLQNIVSK